MPLPAKSCGSRWFCSLLVLLECSEYPFIMWYTVTFTASMIFGMIFGKDVLNVLGGVPPKWFLECIVELCQLLAAELKRSTARSSALTVSTLVLVALRFYAAGSMQCVVRDLHGISQPSVSRCVHAVSKLLTCIHQVSNRRCHSTQGKAMIDFYKTAAFPNVLGCVNGTQIPILSRINENVCVPKRLSFTQCTSSVWCTTVFHKHCGKISRQCTQFLHMAKLGSVSLPGTARSGTSVMAPWRQWFPLSSFLLTPIPTPTIQAETTYNKKHSQTQNTVEHSFGLLKMRFRCLHSTGGCLQSPRERCAQIITACASCCCYSSTASSWTVAAVSQYWWLSHTRYEMRAFRYWNLPSVSALMMANAFMHFLRYENDTRYLYRHFFSFKYTLLL